MRFPPVMILLAAMTPVLAQHSTRNNPFNTPADRATGAKVFLAQCAACHGRDGAGGAGGPELVTGTFRHGDSDEALFQTVMHGVAGTNMPVFPGTPREAWQVVAFIRTLSEGRAALKAKGNAQRGAMLFDQHGCRGCHSIKGEGGVTGPDLSMIGTSRSLAQITRSITAPNDDVSPEFWTLRARTKSGEQIAGVRLNEDTFSYQFVDGKGLRSVLKSDLGEHQTVRTSVMPSYAGKLTAADIDDLAAFLAARTKGGGE